MRNYIILIFLLLTFNVYAADKASLQSANGLAISSSNPLPVSISGANFDASTVFNVKSSTYGALGDGIHLYDGAITSSTAAFTSATAVFTAADVGKVITIVGAGAAGVDLTTTIAAFVSATAVTLTATASTTVSSKDFTYGTDDTVAIQAAINAAGTNGSGTVFFPKGIYIINGAFGTSPASQLYLPSVGEGKTTQIMLQGTNFQESSAGSLTSPYGSILFFTKNGTSSQSGLAIHGTIYNNFSNILVQMRNLTIRMVTNPTSTAVDLRQAMQADIDYVNFDHDYTFGSGYVSYSLVVPTHDTNYALMLPDQGNHAFVVVDHVQIFNYYTGIFMQEHAVLDNSGIYFCKIALEVNGNGHTKMIKFITLEDNIYNIVFSGSSPVALQADMLDIEHAGSGSFQTTNDIYDPSNLGTGQIHYNISLGTFTKSGGTGLIYYDQSSLVGVTSAGVLDVNFGASAHMKWLAYPGDTGYNLWTLNGATDSTYMGIAGGKNGDLGMYWSVPTNGSFNFGANATYNTVILGNGNIGIGQSTAPQALSVTGTETITGNLGIGNTSPGLRLDVTGTARISAAIINTGITSDATHTDSSICQDTTTHQFYSGSGTLGICLGTSSARYKNSIVNMPIGLKQILGLQPKNFYYNKNAGDFGKKLQYGLIAEDVVKVIPDLVGLDEKGKPNSVDLLGMIPILIHSTKELQDEISDLNKRVYKLEHK